MLAMRLHSLIYASAVCVPTVGLSYDPKIDAFMQYICAGEEAISVADFDSTELFKVLQNSLENEAEKRKVLAEKREMLQELAKLNAVRVMELLNQAEGNYTYETHGN